MAGPMVNIVTEYTTATNTMPANTSQKPHGLLCCGPPVLSCSCSLLTRSSLPFIESGLSTPGSSVLGCFTPARTTSRSKTPCTRVSPLPFVVDFRPPPWSLDLSGISADEPENLPTDLLKIDVLEIVAIVPFYGFRPVRFVSTIPASLMDSPP